MTEKQTTSSAAARFVAIVKTRRAMVAAGVAGVSAVLAAVTAEDVSASGRKNRRQHRKRHDRRQRRRGNHRGNQSGGGPDGDNDCFVCEKLSDGSNCRFSSIQAAINAAGDGESISVCAGTFKEGLTFSSTTIATLTIRGAGAEATTLDADGDGSAVVVDQGQIVAIHGMTITGGSADRGGGVYNRGFLTLADCVVTNNDTGAEGIGGGGIFNDDFAELVLNSTQVSDNTTLQGRGGGIWNFGGTVSLREFSSVTGNSAAEAGGIFNEGGNNLSIDSSSSVTGNTPNNCVGATC